MKPLEIVHLENMIGKQLKLTIGSKKITSKIQKHSNTYTLDKTGLVDSLNLSYNNLKVIDLSLLHNLKLLNYSYPQKSDSKLNKLFYIKFAVYDKEKVNIGI